MLGSGLEKTLIFKKGFKGFFKVLKMLFRFFV